VSELYPVARTRVIPMVPRPIAVSSLLPLSLPDPRTAPRPDYSRFLRDVIVDVSRPSHLSHPLG